MVIKPMLDQAKRIAESPRNSRCVRPDGQKAGGLRSIWALDAAGFRCEEIALRIPMSLTVKIGEAKTRLSELLAKVEAGEEVVIARGHEPIARLTRVLKPDDFAALVAEVKASRAKRAKTSPEELLAWRDEGRRF